jgi:hypothetical protein
MTTINQQSHDTAPAAGSSHPVSVDSSARPLSAQLILDAVVAGYIHDISERHPRRPSAGDRTASSDRNQAQLVS